MRLLLIGLMLALAGCQQLPRTPEDIQARKFESVPDKAVIYLVRDNPDFSGIQSQVDLGDKIKLMTYEGTYYRWETAPGTYQIRGFGGDDGSIRVAVERGKIYFVQQRVAGRMVPSSSFEVVGEAPGRAAVLRSVLIRPRQALINE